MRDQDMIEQALDISNEYGLTIEVILSALQHAYQQGQESVADLDVRRAMFYGVNEWVK